MANRWGRGSATEGGKGTARAWDGGPPTAASYPPAPSSARGRARGAALRGGEEVRGNPKAVDTRQLRPELGPDEDLGHHLAVLQDRELLGAADVIDLEVRPMVVQDQGVCPGDVAHPHVVAELAAVLERHRAA